MRKQELGADAFVFAPVSDAGHVKTVAFSLTPIYAVQKFAACRLIDTDFDFGVTTPCATRFDC